MFIEYTVEDIEALIDIVKARYQAAHIPFTKEAEDAAYYQLCGIAECNGLAKAHAAAHTLKLNPCLSKFS
jgi:hypothetical protein